MRTIDEPDDASAARLQELAERLSWITRWRWLAAAGVATTIWIVPRFFAIGLDQRPLYIITTILAFYNLLLWPINRRATQINLAFGLTALANLQIGTDLVILTALLYFSGGIENPFVCYFVFHIVMASILLSRRATFVQVAIAISLLTGMSLLQFWGILPHYHLTGFFSQELHNSPVYLFAVLFVSGTMLFFTAYMATSITMRLREREKKIVQLTSSLQERANELEKAYLSLQQSEREKTEYMNRVAHDIRSPIATVSNMLTVIAEGRTGDIPEECRELLEKAGIRLEHVLRLARDLLSLSYARQSRSAETAQPLDLREVLQQLETDFRARPEAAQLILAFKAPAEAAVTRGDREALVELFENLISNAIKYTPADGKVTVELRSTEKSAEILVSDTGIGIPPEEQQHIFEDFYRAPNARDFGPAGTGLGLSIVQAVARAHGGDVRLESRPGQGSTFAVSLPLLPQSAGDRGVSDS